MPRSFVDQDFVLTVLAVYGVTVAFNRWFPNIDLIAVDAHPQSYAQTFNKSTESAIHFYTAYLAVDIIRLIAMAILEIAAFSFAFSDEKFDLVSYFPVAFTMFGVTKDVLMIGCVHAGAEGNEIAAAKVAELLPVTVYIEQGLTLVGAISLAVGLYQWTYAIGRDKRQVIKEKKTN